MKATAFLQMSFPTSRAFASVNNTVMRNVAPRRFNNVKDILKCNKWAKQNQKGVTQQSVETARTLGQGQ